MLKANEDAFGREISDYYHGKGGFEIVERDDGMFNVSGGPSAYFTEYRHWPPAERKAVSLAQGRVLDIGCGAGRHALYLQSRGHEVVGIDNSPLGVKVCRARGLRKAVLLPVTGLSGRLGRFDTVLMLGNNLSLLGNRRRAPWLLRRIASITSPGARIIGQTRDPYQTREPEHLAYHRRNRKQKKMAGQTRIRIRYKTCATPWFEYLFVSKKELEELVKPTPWRVQRYLDLEQGIYFVVLGK
jgi:SAM-dependent methyltransferase